MFGSESWACFLATSITLWPASAIRVTHFFTDARRLQCSLCSSSGQRKQQMTAQPPAQINTTQHTAEAQDAAHRSHCCLDRQHGRVRECRDRHGFGSVRRAEACTHRGPVLFHCPLRTDQLRNVHFQLGELTQCAGCKGNRHMPSPSGSYN